MGPTVYRMRPEDKEQGSEKNDDKERDLEEDEDVYSVCRGSSEHVGDKTGGTDHVVHRGSCEGEEVEKSTGSHHSLEAENEDAQYVDMTQNDTQTVTNDEHQ